VGVFEQALTASSLTWDDKVDVARFYVDFIRENARSIGYIRNKEQHLKQLGLMFATKKSELQVERMTESALGKRLRDEVEENAGGEGGDEEIEEGEVKRSKV